MFKGGTVNTQSQMRKGSKNPKNVARGCGGVMANRRKVTSYA